MKIPDFDKSYLSRKFVEILEQQTKKKVPEVKTARTSMSLTRAPQLTSLPRPRPDPSSQHAAARYPSRLPAQPKAYPVSSNLNARVRGIYDEITNGSIFAPERQIKLGRRKTQSLSQNGIDEIVLSESGFSPTLTFTFLSALMDKASVIYFGMPGTGKTTAPEVVISSLYGIPIRSIQAATVYGNPELTTSDMVATLDIASLMKGKEIIIPRQFMRSAIRIIDEVNRIPPSKLSILYQLADRGFASFKNRIIEAPPGPLYATANHKDSGNYEIPKPFLDRFDISLVSQTLNPWYMDAYNRRSALAKRSVPPLNPSEVEAVKTRIRKTPIDDDAMSRLSYFLSEISFCDLAGREVENKTKANAKAKLPGALCSECGHYSNDINICNQTIEGVSTRSYSRILNYVRAFAWWQHKPRADRTDLEVVLPYALSHKLTPTRQALEKDPVYINDSHAFVSDLVSKSNRSYDMQVSKSPIIKDIASMITRVYSQGPASGVTRSGIEIILRDDLPKVDSCSKFGLATALTDCYMRLG